MKVLAKIKVSEEVQNCCHVENYSNGREQGFYIIYYPKTTSSFLDGTAVAFAENRNSDEIVVYVGKPRNFTIEGHIPDQETYSRKKFFIDEKEAAKYIKESLLK